MGSLIMHICISNVVKERLGLPNSFLAGSVIPDLIKLSGVDSNITHYSKLYTTDKGVKSLPDLDRFVIENTYKLEDKSTLGYYAHLVEDKVWFDDYIGKYIIWHDDNLELITNLKTQKTCTYTSFSKGIHSDYNQVNNYIIQKYSLNMEMLLGNIVKELNNQDLAKFLYSYSLANTATEKNDQKRHFISDQDADDYIKKSIEITEKEIKKLI